MASCINDAPKVREDLKVGDMIPDFLVEMNDGSSVSSTQLCDGVSVIMFFHTTCPDCARTLPEVQKLYDSYQLVGCKFVLISREETGDSIGIYWTEKDLTMPYSAQATRSVYELFASSRIPRVYICVNGVIKAIYTDSPTPTYEEMSSVLAELI